MEPSPTPVIRTLAEKLVSLDGNTSEQALAEAETLRDSIRNACSERGVSLGVVTAIMEGMRQERDKPVKRGGR